MKMQEALEEVKKEEERLQAEAEAKQLALEKAEAERLERVLYARNYSYYYAYYLRSPKLLFLQFAEH